VSLPVPGDDHDLQLLVELDADLRLLEVQRDLQAQTDVPNRARSCGRDRRDVALPQPIRTRVAWAGPGACGEIGAVRALVCR
jgi:hypothetical protein